VGELGTLLMMWVMYEMVMARKQLGVVLARVVSWILLARSPYWRAAQKVVGVHLVQTLHSQSRFRDDYWSHLGHAVESQPPLWVVCCS
jgi:hypothetical protein